MLYTLDKLKKMIKEQKTKILATKKLRDESLTGATYRYRLEQQNGRLVRLKAQKKLLTTKTKVEKPTEKNKKKAKKRGKSKK